MLALVLENRTASSARTRFEIEGGVSAPAAASDMLYPRPPASSQRMSGSMKTMNRKGLSVSPCSVPRCTPYSSVSPCGVMTEETWDV